MLIKQYAILLRYWRTNTSYVDVMKQLTTMFEDNTDVVLIIQITNEYVLLNLHDLLLKFKADFLSRTAGLCSTILNPGLLAILKQVCNFHWHTLLSLLSINTAPTTSSGEFASAINFSILLTTYVATHSPERRATSWSCSMMVFGTSITGTVSRLGVMMDTHIYRMFNDHIQSASRRANPPGITDFV